MSDRRNPRRPLRQTTRNKRAQQWIAQHVGKEVSR